MSRSIISFSDRQMKDKSAELSTGSINMKKLGYIKLLAIFMRVSL